MLSSHYFFKTLSFCDGRSRKRQHVQALQARVAVLEHANANLSCQAAKQDTELTWLRREAAHQSEGIKS